MTVNITVPEPLNAKVIEAKLAPFGTPIRWAITQVSEEVCTIEAVVVHPPAPDVPLSDLLEGDAP